MQRGDEGDAMIAAAVLIDLGEVPAPPDLTVGDFFGELSLLTEGRSATIVANDAVRCGCPRPT